MTRIPAEEVRPGLFMPIIRVQTTILGTPVSSPHSLTRVQTFRWYQLHSFGPTASIRTPSERLATNLRVAEINAETGADAAWLSGTDNVRLPDAVHLASAQRNEATAWVTNDRTIRSRPNLTVVLLSELDAA